MAAPTVTSDQTLLSSQSLAANGTVTADLDIRTKWEARLQVKNLGGGSVAATNGVQVDVFRHVNGGTTRPDTVASLSVVIPTTASTEKEYPVTLSAGSYRVKLTNLDGTNAVTVDILYETTDAVA